MLEPGHPWLGNEKPSQTKVEKKAKQATFTIILERKRKVGFRSVPTDRQRCCVSDVKHAEPTELLVLFPRSIGSGTPGWAMASLFIVSHFAVQADIKYAFLKC